MRKRMTEAERKRHIEAIQKLWSLIVFLDSDENERAAKLKEIHAAEKAGLINHDTAIELANEFC